MIYSGKTFGQLTVLSIPTKLKSHWYWNCKCTCGNTKLMREVHLRDGVATSCGLCNWKELHPLAYKSWDSMKQRCLNPNAPDYARYGGRGITICPEWRAHFYNFFQDLGDPPIDIHGVRFTLNRKDNNGPYNKDNCNWASAYEQNMNRSNTLHSGVSCYSNGNRR